MDINYYSCLQKLQEVQEIKNLVSIPEIMNRLQRADPHKNYTRRYFETRLAQYNLYEKYHGEQKQAFFDVIKELGIGLLDISIDNIEDAEFFLGTMTKNAKFKPWDASYAERAFCVQNGILFDICRTTLLHKSLMFEKMSKTFRKHRDRTYRMPDGKPFVAPVTIAEHPEKAQGMATEYSCVSGQFRSIQPLPRTDVSDNVMRNVPVDLTTFTKGIDGEHLYPQQNMNSPYVSSMSGHTFWMLSELEEYAIAHKGDPNLNNKINLILNSAISVFSRRGWHSIHEMVNCMREDFIQERFKNLGITLEPLAYFPANVKDCALEDAIDYAVKQVSRSNLNNQITSLTSIWHQSKSVVQHSEQHSDPLLFSDMKAVTIHRSHRLQCGSSLTRHLLTHSKLSVNNKPITKTRGT